jgi:hypothetical protein
VPASGCWFYDSLPTLVEGEAHDGPNGRPCLYLSAAC